MRSLPALSLAPLKRVETNLCLRHYAVTTGDLPGKRQVLPGRTDCQESRCRKADREAWFRNIREMWGCLAQFHSDKDEVLWTIRRGIIAFETAS
jgi:hypothetical protein